MCSEHQWKREDNILCPQCDMLVVLPEVPLGTKGSCPRCKTTLVMQWHDPRWQPVLFALSALFMLLLANLFPFVTFSVKGLHNAITLINIPSMLFSENYTSIAILFMFLVQLLPAFCMGCIIVLSLQWRLPLGMKVMMAKVLFQCRSWCMVEIFLAGVLVSFVKLVNYGDVGIGSSFIPYCLFCLLQIRAFQCIDRRRLWNTISPLPIYPQQARAGISGIQQGLRACDCCSAILPVSQRVCPRCGTYGEGRRTHSLQWTLALLTSALILYIPANLLPIMVTQALGSKLHSTIMSGVIFLWGEGSYPVALVIFIASIMVPSIKIMAIAWLCWDVRYGRRGNSEQMHFVYELIEFVGRWSMIDVFVIAVLSALVNIGQLMNIYPEIGAILFGFVVIITMVASTTFDPRLIWDREHNLMAKESLCE